MLFKMGEICIKHYLEILIVTAKITPASFHLFSNSHFMRVLLMLLKLSLCVDVIPAQHKTQVTQKHIHYIKQQGR